MNSNFSVADPDDINTKIDKIELSVNEGSCRDVIGFIDLTSLNITDNEPSISLLVEKVNESPEQFPGFPVVAGICVFPRFVPLVKKKLRLASVKIVSVSASFPFAQTFREVKISESRMAVDMGADEIDIVLPTGDLFNSEYNRIKDEISEIKRSIGEAHLKVILESGLLETPGRIYTAAMIAMEAGADFIKTSTGKSSVSATPLAAWVMCSAIADYYKESGRMVGFKPAGGISESNSAHLYMGIVRELLGERWLVPEYFRIGASRLANDLLSCSLGREVSYY